MHRKLALPALVAAALTAGGVLVAASPAPAATGGTISVAYENYGTNITLNEMLHNAAKEFAAKYPGWTINLEPIAASEPAYYTKMDLMSSSASTAPDVLYEDTFLVNSDVSAGFLAPLDSYVASWPQWKEYSPAAQAAAKSANGHIYGVSMGTDTRGIYYNKQLLSKAGVKMPFDPKTWAQIVAAAQAVKKADPGVTPINIYSGTAPGEATTMQGFEMFLYGTNNPLFDYSTGKWEMAGAGFTAALNAYKTFFSGGLAETPQQASGANWGSQVPVLLSQGKLAMDLSGSWEASDWLKSGIDPWPQYASVMDWTAMPSENGQGAGHVSMSGGWLLSVGSHASNKQMAFNFITIALDYQNSLFYDIGAGQIASRADVAATPSYKDANASVSTFSSFVPFTHFRPAFSDYPKLSNEIQLITGQVMTGQATPAQGAASYNKYLVSVVGKSATEAAPM
jgi:multiple sugar transport system substrate-binding protein